MPPEKSKRDESTENKNDGKQAKSRGRKKILLPVIILVVFLFSGALFVVGTETGGEMLQVLTGEPGAADEGGGPEYKYEVPEILINLSDEQQRGSFLSVKFYLGFDETALNEEIESRMPEIRDSVLDILWDKKITEDEIEEEKEDLRAQIMSSTNEILQEGEVKEVYFWHLLIQ